MIILVKGKSVSVTVKDIDLMEGKRDFYVFCTTANGVSGYYDPANEFKPCFENPDETPRRRLHESYVNEYITLFEEANAAFDRTKAIYDAKIQKIADERAAKVAPAAPVVPQGGLGAQLEELMLKVLAEQSVDKVLELAKPILDDHIRSVYGILPQIIEVKSQKGTQAVKGITHEKFGEVVSLVGADIPVFLTGPAGTGKNVLCKQVAEALGLEFYFSNAVTQEYKITCFIDANGTFQDTQFYQAFTKGGLFMLDEMDASVPEVLVMLNAAIANRYFDFPTGRVEAHEDFRLIAAGNTFGTGADMEYTGRYQLDAASLDRFALVSINYSPKIEEAIANGNEQLVDYIRGFRNATADAGIKHLATYRSIERISKLDETMETGEVLKICLLKNLPNDDLRIIVDSMRDRVDANNKYLKATKNILRHA